MFEGFEQKTIDTGEALIRVRKGGSGPAVLLLHGIPETHLMWHKVAPRLARDFTVVAADLRGYGDSSKPPTAFDHAPYSKRAMARDQVELMRQQGFDRFFVAGHDRGARCAYRLALDHPHAVLKLAVLDIVPTGDVFRRADMTLGLAFWVWFFLAQPYDLPERVIGRDPQLFLDYMLDSWSEVPGSFPDEVRAEYGRAFRSRRGFLQTWEDVLAVWREWADDVRGRAIDCGHFLPEEAPDETFTELHMFLTS
ncbi:MAG TPA: alpha/beta hydrolase [Gemmatimonadota bacterium]|nr:alpha/beta hydrolase [Gemmatimonadota bacterium]